MKISPEVALAASLLAPIVSGCEPSPETKALGEKRSDEWLEQCIEFVNDPTHEVKHSENIYYLSYGPCDAYLVTDTSARALVAFTKRHPELEIVATIPEQRDRYVEGVTVVVRKKGE